MTGLEVSKYNEGDKAYLLVNFAAPDDIQKYEPAVTNLEVVVKWWAEETQPTILNKTVRIYHFVQVW